jgi:hypothetical protein
MSPTDWQRTAERDPDHAARVRAIAHGIPARYADDQPTPEPCPECRAGKCRNCDGATWDTVRDEPAPCPCAEAGHGDES